jgi:hypothetical protein
MTGIIVAGHQNHRDDLDAAKLIELVRPDNIWFIVASRGEAIGKTSPRNR